MIPAIAGPYHGSWGSPEMPLTRLAGCSRSSASTAGPPIPDHRRSRADTDLAAQRYPHPELSRCVDSLEPDNYEQIAHAYGDNTIRLLAAKRHYDPDGVFAAIPLPVGTGRRVT